MKNLQKITSLALCALSLTAFTHTNAAATTITQWTYEGLSTSGVNTNPTASTGTGTTTPIGMTLDGSSQNTGIATQAGTDTNPPNTATTNKELKVRGGTGGGTNNGWDASEPIGTQGVQFSVSTIGYAGISASFDWYPSTNGEAKLQLQYSVNGSSWINAPASEISIPTSSTLSLITNTTSGTNNLVGTYIDASAGNTWYNDITLTLTSVSGVNNDANFGIRLLNAATGSADVQAGDNTSQIGSSGNWSFDNVTISGSVAAPEPGTWALMLSFLAALTFYHSRKKRLARNV